MFTYSLMALPFFAVVLLLDFVVLKTKVIKKKRTWQVMAGMLLITAVFDQFLTGLPIVHYTEENTLGLRLLFAPIEDFTYTIAAVIGVGAAIDYGKKHHDL